MLELHRARLTTVLTVALLLCLPTVATAQDATAPGSEEQIEIPWIKGPSTVDLGDVARVELPNGYLFADAEITQALMESMGNPPSGQEVGLITTDESTWFIVFEYAPVGYVSDEDSNEIDADALLKSISDATEAANRQRSAMGSAALHVTGWSEAPRYDPISNNLVWALEAADEEGSKVVNFNVRILGRGGYMSATLVTDPAQLARDKPEINAVLAGFNYQDGSSYGDFISGDKMAGYGLAALVAGGTAAAAAKLGLFAVLAKFFGKIWKLVLIAFFFVVANIKRLGRMLTGRSANAPEAAE